MDGIETRQLLWCEHVMRMKVGRLPKRAVKYTPQNRRRGGISVMVTRELIKSSVDRYGQRRERVDEYRDVGCSGGCVW